MNGCTHRGVAEMQSVEVDVRDDGGDHSSDCTDRLPSQRDDRPDVNRGRYRWELPTADRQQGGDIGPSCRPARCRVPDARRKTASGSHVLPGYRDDNAFGSFPNHWEQICKGSPLSHVTPHLLRHSFASVSNDLGFTDVTIAALVATPKGSSPADTSTRWTPPRSGRRTPLLATLRAYWTEWSSSRPPTRSTETPKKPRSRASFLKPPATTRSTRSRRVWPPKIPPF